MNITHPNVNVIRVVSPTVVEGYNAQHKTMGKYEIHFANNAYGYKLKTGVKMTDLGVMYVQNDTYSIEFELERRRTVLSKVVCKMHKGENRHGAVINHSDSEVKVTKNKKIIFEYISSSVISGVTGLVLDIDDLNTRFADHDDIYDYRSLPVTYAPLKKYDTMLQSNYFIANYKKLLELLDKEKVSESAGAVGAVGDVDGVGNAGDAIGVAGAVGEDIGLPNSVPKTHIDAVCTVCNDNPPTYAMKECMHLCLCEDCESDIDRCPICRVSGDKAKVYY